MHRKLLIAVMILGVGSLAYWAVSVVDYRTPTEQPSAAPERTSDAPVHEATRPIAEVQSPSEAEESDLAATTALVSPGERTQSSGQNAIGSGAVDPIALIPAQQKTLDMLQKRNPNAPLVKMHALLSDESRDPDWSYAMEQQLTTFFLSRASQLGIEVPTVACRTSGCEVLLISAQNNAPFDQLVGAARGEPWFASFEPQAMLRGWDGNLAHFWMILKRR